MNRASIKNRSSINDSILYLNDNNREISLLRKYYEAKLNE